MPCAAPRPVNLAPFKITEPTVISFSGGRTSGYMLRLFLDANGGELPADLCRVVFANTGKERCETLDFVERCGQQWGVAITWVEYRFIREDGTKLVNGREKPAGTAGFSVVDYATASRDGEPFEQVVTQRNFLPNPVTRFCTIDLKIRPIQKFARSLGWDDFVMAVGLRADEPRRVEKGKRQNRDGYDKLFPLFDADVTEPEVLAFWRRQPFDLQLQTHEGNCDLCFLKGKHKIVRILKERPDLAQWWADMERRIQGGRFGNEHFRNDRPGYAALLSESQRPSLFEDSAQADELSEHCSCTD